MASGLDLAGAAAAIAMNGESGPVVLFDGVCNLCQNSVRFVIRRDRRERFRFGSLQSEAGRALLARHGIEDTGLTSIVLLEDGRFYRKSTAALKIARRLDGMWPVLYVFIVVPAVIRDAVYDFIGRRRYRWFGRSETCWIKTDAMRERFIE